MSITKLYPPLTSNKDKGFYCRTCPFCNGEFFTYTEDSFTCWDCGVTGDAADFLALKNKLPRSLAKWKLEEDTSEAEYKKYYSVLKLVCELYEKNLSWNNPYLKERKISPEIAKRFHLGLATGNLKYKVSAETKDALVTLGLIRPDGRDFFTNRLMIPVFDYKGKVVGFGGRRIFESEKFPTPKYINSPESCLFSKRDLLFGIQNINPNKPVYIVEGYFDVITAQTAGVNAVACLGTAITLGHIELLRALNVSKVIVALDSDGAGLKNAIKAANLLRPYFETRCLPMLPVGKDPDEFIKIYGGDAFNELKTISAEYFLIQQGINPVDVL